VINEYINLKSFKIIIPVIMISASIIKMTMPGLIPFDFEINSANKSTPPGLIWNLNIIPTPIPIIIPPSIALVMIGRCTIPLSGTSKSIIVDVKANPRIALMKYDLSYLSARR
jgi:hypothetical protein